MSNIFEKRKSFVDNLKSKITQKTIESKKGLSPNLLRNPSLNLQNKILEKFLNDGDSTKGLPVKSIISKTVFNYNIPEIENLKIDFVYNYFTKDERSFESANLKDRIINLEVESISEAIYNATNELIPRYVKFSFTPPRDPYTKIETKNNESLIENFKNIIKEGASSSKFFTGFELKDTGEEKSIYLNLKNSSAVANLIEPEDSSLSLAKKINEEISDNGITGQNKKLLLESLSQLKDDEMIYAQSDVHPEVANFSDNPVGRQTFSIKINNLFINDIIKKANRLPTGVYQDEIDSLSKITPDYQKNILSKIGNDPTKIYEDEFINNVDAFEIISVNSKAYTPAMKNLLTKKDYETKLLGYVIEKTEILPDESINVMDPIIVSDPRNLYVKDDNVRYGGNYAYTIRTLCQVIVPVVKIDPDNPLLDEVVLAKFIMMSEGVTKSVYCIEKVPPPPPTGIRVRFDFKSKKPIVTWQFPVNPQRDIKRFQIFKRLNIDLPFTLVAEYDFDNSIFKTDVNEIAQSKNLIQMEFPKTSFIDENFNISSTPIYSIASVDAHGMTSNLSTQIQIRYDKLKNKLISKLISREGSPKQYPNIYLEEDTFKDVIKSSGSQRMHIFFDPEYYKVTKNDKINSFKTLEKDLKLIASDPNNATYSIQILNLDLQKEGIINITIDDKSLLPEKITSKSFTKNET